MPSSERRRTTKATLDVAQSAVQLLAAKHYIAKETKNNKLIYSMGLDFIKGTVLKVRLQIRRQTNIYRTN